MPSAASEKVTATVSCESAYPTPTTTISQPMAFPGRRTTRIDPTDAQLRPATAYPSMAASLNPNAPMNGAGETDRTTAVPTAPAIARLSPTVA